MRISVLKTDTGYKDYAFLYRVKLNGEILKGCVTADENIGLAICHKKDENGELILNRETMEVETFEIYGNVEIIKPVLFKVIQHHFRVWRIRTFYYRNFRIRA